jgi:hypothetical protein
MVAPTAHAVEGVINDVVDNLDSRISDTIDHAGSTVGSVVATAIGQATTAANTVATGAITQVNQALQARMGDANVMMEARIAQIDTDANGLVYRRRHEAAQPSRRGPRVAPRAGQRYRPNGHQPGRPRRPGAHPAGG